VRLPLARGFFRSRGPEVRVLALLLVGRDEPRVPFRTSETSSMGLAQPARAARAQRPPDRPGAPNGKGR